MYATKPLLEFRPVEAPSAATPGARVYMLLPSVETLVNRPKFGRPDPIRLPGSPRLYDPRRFFERFRRTGTAVH